jgi:hypothetical protein
MALTVWFLLMHHAYAPVLQGNLLAHQLNSRCFLCFFGYVRYADAHQLLSMQAVFTCVQCLRWYWNSGRPPVSPLLYVDVGGLLCVYGER